MEADEERIRLEKLAEELATREDDDSQEYLMTVSYSIYYFDPPPSFLRPPDPHPLLFCDPFHTLLFGTRYQLFLP